jgi:hypothetical protein
VFRLLSPRGESRGVAAAWGPEHHFEVVDARALRGVQVMSDGFGAWRGIQYGRCGDPPEATTMADATSPLGRG